MTFSWLKGHGTENDFVLLPDHDGSVHGDLDAAFVAELCDRRRGIGADGVMRVIRSSALDDPHARDAAGAGAEWFMDYRNADGSVSEMCGNGVRVFALHLAQDGLVDPAGPVAIGTRDGVKTVTFADPATPAAGISVDMGAPQVHLTSKVAANGHVWEALHVSTGNPHAIAFVDDLRDAGPLLEEPEYDHDVYPDGVNIEFVVREGDQHVALRVHERGSGETRSCGTGACAVGVAAMLTDTVERPATYRVDVPGGTLHVTWREDDHLVLTGPARIVARGQMEWIS